MNVADVSREELGNLQSIQNILKTAEIKVSPAECAAIGDVLRWFTSELCVKAGKAFQQEKAALPAASPPSEGLKIKEFSPGAASE